MTFIFQHKAVPYCNEHLSFPRRARENKHQHLLYSNKPKLFNTFSDEKLLDKFSNSALQKARKCSLPSPEEKDGMSRD